MTRRAPRLAAAITALALGAGGLALSATPAHAATKWQTPTTKPMRQSWDSPSSGVRSGTNYGVVQLINAERAKVGAPPVRYSTSNAAVGRQCATRNTSTPLTHCGYENLYATTARTALPSDRRIVNAWMNSPVHRQAMLDPRVTEIGVGWGQSTSTGRTVYAATMTRR